MLLERLISQAQAARKDAERRDAEIAAASRQQGILREQELAAKSMQADRMGEVLDGFMREMMEPTEKLHVAAKELNANAESLSEMAQQAKTQSVAVVTALRADGGHGAVRRRGGRGAGADDRRGRGPCRRIRPGWRPVR